MEILKSQNWDHFDFNGAILDNLHKKAGNFIRSGCCKNIQKKKRNTGQLVLKTQQKKIFVVFFMINWFSKNYKNKNLYFLESIGGKNATQ